MGVYMSASVLLVTISIGLFNPPPQDHLTVNLNLDDSPEGQHFGKTNIPDGNMIFKSGKKDKCPEKEVKKYQGYRKNKNGPKKRIKGGTIAAWEDWPWIASIRVISDPPPRYGFLCAGTLINCQYVLTALHCLTDFDTHYIYPLHKIYVHLKSDIVFQGKPKRVEQVFYANMPQKVSFFPGTDKPLDDIALIKLAIPINPKEIPPILLPVRNLKPSVDEYSIAGWGYIYFNPVTQKYTENQHLRQTKSLEVVDPCPDYVLENSIGNIICTRQTGTNAICNGDSGSPAVISELDGSGERYRWYLQGVVLGSYGGCNETYGTGVQANVLHYKGLINTWMEQEGNI